MKTDTDYGLPLTVPSTLQANATFSNDYESSEALSQFIFFSNLSEISASSYISVSVAGLPNFPLSSFFEGESANGGCYLIQYFTVAETTGYVLQLNITLNDQFQLIDYSNPNDGFIATQPDVSTVTGELNAGDLYEVYYITKASAEATGFESISNSDVSSFDLEIPEPAPIYFVSLSLLVLGLGHWVMRSRPS